MDATPPKMRFGTGTTVRNFDAYRKWLITAEAAGFDMLTTGDSQSLWADCFSVMSLAAELTTTPDLAISVSNPMTRHPAVSASASASVQQISNGRFRLGLASGDSALRNIGVRAAKVREIEDYARAVQQATSGGPASWEGTTFSLHWLEDPTPVPVWIAAEGPRMQRMAGRVADGVILSNCLTPERLEIALANIGDGAAEAGRSMDDIEIWHMVNLIFAASEEEGVDSIRSVLAGTANHVYRFTLEGKGLPDELHEPMTAMMGEYQSRHHAHPGTSNPNETLVDRYGLKDYLSRLGTIAGPPDWCAHRIREVGGYGATNLIVSQFVADQEQWMRTFADEVRPAFA